MADITHHRSFIIEYLIDKDPFPVLLEGTKKLKDNWWLSFGTILGIHRDKGFIPTDTDIDVSMVGGIDRASMHDDFELIRTSDKGGIQFQSCYIHVPTNIIFDINQYQEDGDEYYTERQNGEQTRVPKKFFDPLGTVKFNGHEFPAPNDIEGYLENLYGDWKTPVEKGKPEWK